jgi:hypothetical protein
MTNGSLLDRVLRPFRSLSETLQRIKSLLKKEEPQLVNLTPHDVVIRNDDEDIVIPKSGMVARVKETVIHKEIINGVQVTDIHYEKTSNLPECKDGIYYIVSIVVAYANSGRHDLVFPDGLNAYRDEKGQIEAVPGLRRIVETPGSTERIAGFFNISKAT